MSSPMKVFDSYGSNPLPADAQIWAGLTDVTTAVTNSNDSFYMHVDLTRLGRLDADRIYPTGGGFWIEFIVACMQRSTHTLIGVGTTRALYSWTGGALGELAFVAEGATPELLGSGIAGLNAVYPTEARHARLAISPGTTSVCEWRALGRAYFFCLSSIL